MVCHLAPCKFPMKNGLAGQISTPPRGVPGAHPPLRGGIFSASRPGRGGSPPLGGPQGAKKGQKRPFLGHFGGFFPTGGVWQEKAQKTAFYRGFSLISTQNLNHLCSIYSLYPIYI